jgi:hypothetical protein
MGAAKMISKEGGKNFAYKFTLKPFKTILLIALE